MDWDKATNKQTREGGKKDKTIAIGEEFRIDQDDKVYAAGGTAPATGPSLASGVFSMLWKSRISEYIMIWNQSKEDDELSSSHGDSSG